MRVVSTFPRAVREIQHQWIPLADGTKLAARIWLPEDAARNKVPAILEYLPYRQRDGTYKRDASNHAYFAGHGYACLRVDMRGSGDSDGVLMDEYLEQEQLDAVEVIDWIAKQPWSTGAVGMIGISWGGFNGLQVAARRPPALKAIITLCSTDDRYADDVHFMGGCLLTNNMGWGCTMFAFNARPPDPLIVGEAWREVWRKRLEETPHFFETWLRHQRRDALWQQGSVNEDFGAIQCAVYAVGGWEDGYTNAIPRLMTGLKVPRKGLIGPWAHSYPHAAHIMPVGFLQDALRWWDQWLKGRDTGVMAEPMLRAWLQDSVEPRQRYTERPGRWVGERVWPSPQIKPKTYFLAPGRLVGGAGESVPLTLSSQQTTGIASGVWCPYGGDSDMPTDQREDDGNALCFDSEPLAERLEVLGAPEVTLELAVDRPLALICVRLCDVEPNGASTRVSYGPLNLTHRDGHAEPKPLVPGERIRVTVKLNDLGHAFLPGHRLRLAISTSYWPLLWPSPEPVTLTLFTGANAKLALPERPPRKEDSRLPPFQPAEGASAAKATELVPALRRVRVERDVAAGTQTYTFETSRGRTHFPQHGLTVELKGSNRFQIRPDDPLSARVESTWTTLHERPAGPKRPEWRVRTETRTVMTSTKTHFKLEARLEAYEGSTLVFERDWNTEIPRDGV
ncbi:MAG: CocE/NonD family hydrolase [Proteobacteria bacterium]|nr:CocE/NonD family hydrolase [Pseudomonadota bacterium]MBI3499840.1 CocE/NonD family hydrolase [Pseudomonadota bacterium]